MKITVFGEILWDVFGDDKKIGGAPFNFAAHALKVGSEVQIISAVGDDVLGKAALSAAEGLGMDTASVSVIDKPTGYCNVTLNDGTPSYDLVRGVAYDHIPLPGQDCGGDAFYFGTLAQRNAESADTLAKLLEIGYKEVFFDINIRQNYYSDEMIDRSLKAATILKISREEIGVLGIAGTPEEICVTVAKKYPGLRLIIVTLDKDGALAFRCADGKISRSPKPQSKAVSTVGAGDSFSACFLSHYLAGADIDTCLAKATVLSDYVVTQLGAVPDYPEEIRKQIVL